MSDSEKVPRAKLLPVTTSSPAQHFLYTPCSQRCATLCLLTAIMFPVQGLKLRRSLPGRCRLGVPARCMG